MTLYGINLFGPTLPKIGLSGRIDLAKNLQLYLQIWIIRHQDEEDVKKKAFAEFLRASIWGPASELSAEPVSENLAASISFMKNFTSKIKEASKTGKNGTYYPDEVVWLVKQVRKMALPLNIIVPGEEGSPATRCKILDLSLEIYPPKTYSIIYKPFNKKPLDLSKMKNFGEIKFFQSKHLEPTPIPKPKKAPKAIIEPEEDASDAAPAQFEEESEALAETPATEEEKVPTATEEEHREEGQTEEGQSAESTEEEASPAEEEVPPLSEPEEEEEAIAAPAEEQTEAKKETNPIEIEAESREKAAEKAFFSHPNIGILLMKSFARKGFEDFLKSGATLNDDESGRKIAAGKLKTFMKSSPGLNRWIEGKEIPEDVMDGLVEMLLYLRSNRNVKITDINIKLLLSIALDELVLVNKDGTPILFNGKLLRMNDMANINARIVSTKMKYLINASELKYLDLLDPEKLAKLGHTLESFEDFINEQSIAIKEAKGYKCRKAAKKEAEAAAAPAPVEKPELEEEHTEETPETNALPDAEEESALFAEEEKASAAASRAKEEIVATSVAAAADTELSSEEEEEEELAEAPNEAEANLSDNEDEAPAELERVAASDAAGPAEEEIVAASVAAAAAAELSSEDEQEEEIIPPHKLPDHLNFDDVTHSLLPSKIGSIDYGSVLPIGLNKTSRKKPIKMEKVCKNQHKKTFYCDPQNQAEDRISLRLINEGKTKDGLSGNFIDIKSGAMLAGYVLNSKIKDFISVYDNGNFRIELVHEHNRIVPLKALIHYFVQSICSEMPSQKFTGTLEERAEKKGQFLIDELPKKFESFAGNAAKKGILFNFELLACESYLGKPEECLNMLSLELFDIPKFKSICEWAKMPFEAAVKSTMNIFKGMAHDAFLYQYPQLKTLYGDLERKLIGHYYSQDFPIEDAFATHPNHEEIIGFANAHEDSSA